MGTTVTAWDEDRLVRLIGVDDPDTISDADAAYVRAFVMCAGEERQDRIFERVEAERHERGIWH